MAHRVDTGAVAHVRCDRTLDLAPHPCVGQAVRLLEEEADLVGVRVRVGVVVAVAVAVAVAVRVGVRLSMTSLPFLRCQISSSTIRASIVGGSWTALAMASRLSPRR
jgi:hypothetical protein